MPDSTSAPDGGDWEISITTKTPRHQESVAAWCLGVLVVNVHGGFSPAPRPAVNDRATDGEARLRGLEDVTPRWLSGPWW